MVRKAYLILMVCAYSHIYSFSFSSWFKSEPLATKVEEKNVTKVRTPKELTLPDIKEKDLIVSYCRSVFINNETALIRKLVNSINKYSGNNASQVYATIITWALENEYSHVEKFVRTISRRTLQRTYKDQQPLKYYIFIQSIYNHNTDLMEFLLPKLSNDMIIDKDVNKMTPLEHASAADNQEAVTILSHKIEAINKEKKEGWSFFGALCAGVTYGFVRAMTDPDVYVVRHTYYRPVILI